MEMIVETKKYQLLPKTYLWFAFREHFYTKWWVSALLLASAVSAFFFSYHKLGGSLICGALLYHTFWLCQFYAVTLLKEHRLFFEPFVYLIGPKEITIRLTPKQGMNIAWGKIQKVEKGKRYLLLFLSPAQFLYLPHKIFREAYELDFCYRLLEQKKLL